MDEHFDQAAEPAAAFQKLWTDTFAKTLRAAFTPGNNSPPPERLRQIRTAMFQVLAEAWDSFMRSPQFLDSMRQWMDNAVSFRRLTNDFMARVRNETQSPSREDIDTVMLSVRHMEKRLLDRLDELSASVELLKGQLSARPGARPPSKPAAQKPASTKSAAKPGRRRASRPKS